MKSSCICNLKFLVSTLCLWFCVGLHSENLVLNPGFEDGFQNWPVHNNFGKMPGHIKIVTDETAASGKVFLRMSKEGCDGAAQLISPMIPLAGRDFVFSFQWRGCSPHIRIMVYQKLDGKYVLRKNELGNPAIITFFPNEYSSEWKSFSKKLTLPAEYQNSAIKIQFLRYGSEKPETTDLDEITVIQKVVQDVSPDLGKTQIEVIPPPADNGGIPPMPPLGYRPGVGDGFLTKNGKPFFYVGSTMGGGQWELASLWLLRLQKFSMTMLDWGMNADYRRPDSNRLIISWRDSASAASAVREITRQGIGIEFDGGNYMPEYNPIRNYVKDFPQLKEYYVEGSHFYSFDHNTDAGRRMHYCDWRSRFRFFKDLPLLAFECWNELGYTPSHPRVLAGFREYAKQKYGSLEEACRVWKRDFPTWDEVYPPHLGKNILQGAQAHQYRLAMREKYYQMYYDWLRCVQEDLVPGAREMKREFRSLSTSPFAIDWRGHRHYSDGYMAQDINLLADVIDLHLLHNWQTAFEYNRQPADAPSVLTSVTTGVMYHNFLRTNSRKPILNPECILTRVAMPGSNQEVMKQNCLGQFPAQWKFYWEADNSGLAKGYFKLDFDDSKWGKMAVPGCWDETEEYKGRKGFGWYRADFTVPGSYRMDYRDGSRKFYLYGKGVAQSGTVWINGNEVGRVKGWATEYQIDIGQYLNFGGKNQITFMVDGSNYSNGLRFYVYILPHDRINKTRLYSSKEYASLLWNFMMQGNSGIVIWNWDGIWRPFVAELEAEINSVAEIAMPDARRKYPRQAGILMPFLFFRGLPVAQEKYFLDYLNYYGSLLFLRRPISVFDEDHIGDATPESHPVIFYPCARIVRQSTFDHLKRYVKSGGIAVVTLDSLRMNFERYQDMGLDQFAGIRLGGDYTGEPEICVDGKVLRLTKGDMTGKIGVKFSPEAGTDILARYADGSPAVTERPRGKGKVIFVGGNLDFKSAYTLMASWVKSIPPTLEISDTGDPGEIPYLEGKIAGTPERFLLYVHNWGGLPRRIVCRIGDEYLKSTPSFRVRNVRDLQTPPRQLTASDIREKGFALDVDATSPAAYLFEATTVSPQPLKGISTERCMLLDRIGKLIRQPDNLNSAKRKALFLDREGDYDSGRLVYPQIVFLLQSFGMETWSLPYESLTPELVAKFDLVVLGESHFNGQRKFARDQNRFVKLFIDYVENGGSLFVAALSAKGASSNSKQWLNCAFGAQLGFRIGAYARNDQSCGYQDPMQIRTTNFEPGHPTTSFLESVQFFALPVLATTKKCSLLPLVKTGKDDRSVPDAAIILGGSLGKGKAVFMSESLWHQPFRVEEADNLQLLYNLLAYLTGNEIRKLNSDDRERLTVIPEKLLVAGEARE